MLPPGRQASGRRECTGTAPLSLVPHPAHAPNPASAPCNAWCCDAAVPGARAVPPPPPPGASQLAAPPPPRPLPHEGDGLQQRHRARAGGAPARRGQPQRRAALRRLCLGAQHKCFEGPGRGGHQDGAAGCHKAGRQGPSMGCVCCQRQHAGLREAWLARARPAAPCGCCRLGWPCTMHRAACTLAPTVPQKSVDEAVKRVLREAGRIDILINNAGG